MKTFILNEKRIKTTIAAVLCCLVLTSCWEDFDGKLIAPTNEAPQIKMSSNCILTASDATLEWIEPDAVAYTGMKITCTGNSSTTETTVNRGTTTCTLSGLVNTEYTITLTAIYSTGYNLECLGLKITPPSVTRTLRLVNTAEELAEVRLRLKQPGREMNVDQ